MFFDVKSAIKRVVIFFLVATIVYTSLSLIIAAFPNDLVERNASISLAALEEEGTYPKYFFNSYAALLDNFTDTRMVGAAVTDESKSIVENAMIVHGRVQYWQGYLVLLKPLLVFFQIHQIRYLTYFSFFLLFLFSAVLVYKKLGIPSLIAFSIATIATNVIFISVSLQFISVYYIMFLSVIVLLLWQEHFVSHFETTLVFFFAIGSVVCFIDFLTAPLITLGLPLLLYIISGSKRFNRSTQFLHVIFASASWAIGYSMTFIGKWVMASILLQKNAIAGAVSQLFFRMNGDEELIADRGLMLQKNINLILGFDCFSSTELLGAFVIFALIIGIFVFLFRKKVLPCFRTVTKECWFSNLLILLVGLYPYLWYVVFANHSQIHYWLTYRNQSVTLFALVYILASYLYNGVHAICPSAGAVSSTDRLAS